MKLNKIAAIALAALAFTACSDDDKFNTAADVTVEMGETEVRFAEDQASNTTFFTIPVVLNGEANGEVAITLDVAPFGESQAIEDTHYVITTKHLVIPEGVNKVNVEFYPKGDNVINDDRQFTIKIATADGAQIGTNSTCTVTLVDNEGMIPRAYEEIQGEWNATSNSVFSGSVTGTVEIVGVAEDEEGYQSTLYLMNWPDEGCVVEGKLGVDGATGAASFTFPTGQTVLAGNFKFSDGTSAYCEGKLVFTNGSTGYYSTVDNVIGECDVECKNMTFSFAGYGGLGILLYQDGKTPIGWYEAFNKIVLER